MYSLSLSFSRCFANVRTTTQSHFYRTRISRKRTVYVLSCVSALVSFRLDTLETCDRDHDIHAHEREREREDSRACECYQVGKTRRERSRVCARARAVSERACVCMCMCVAVLARAELGAHARRRRLGQSRSIRRRSRAYRHQHERNNRVSHRRTRWLLPCAPSEPRAIRRGAVAPHPNNTKQKKTKKHPQSRLYRCACV